jgi:hypothetical protein
MLKLESKKGIAEGRQEDVYRFISDFRNFGRLLPEEKLNNLEISADMIRFELTGLGKVGLMIREQVPYSKIIIAATEDSPANFNFLILIHDSGINRSEIKLHLEAGLNMFLEIMARNPLQQFIDMMVDKLVSVDFTKTGLP